MGEGRGGEKRRGEERGIEEKRIVVSATFLVDAAPSELEALVGNARILIELEAAVRDLWH